MDWTLAEIRTNGLNGVRELTGKKSLTNPTNVQLNSAINDYYQNRFPAEVKPQDLKTDFTQSTSPTDSGEYSVSSDVVLLTGPVTVNGLHARLFQDRAEFFALWPDEKLSFAAYCMTAPSLAIGTSSKAAVASSAMTYWIEPYGYSKAAAETALSGDTVPQNKYGAWRLEIDDDGTISIVEASDNATGYDTAAQAVQALEAETADAACMGYVTAMSTDAGGFVPGTTELDDSAVTATYTDGFHSTRNRPLDLLYDRNYLYARPKAEDIYVIQATAYEKPAALSSDSSAVPVPEWGPVIAHATAIEILNAEGDDAKVPALSRAYNYYRNMLERKEISQASSNQRAKPRW